MYCYMGMVFPSEADVPDFGSIKMYYVGDPKNGYQNDGINNKVRGYTLLSDDIPKLDLITNASDGSQALVVDTGDVYLFCSEEWRKWQGGVGATIKWQNIT